MKKISILIATILFFFNPFRVYAAVIVPPPPSFTITQDVTFGGGCQTSINGFDALSLACAAQIVSNLVSLTLTFLGLVTLVFLLWGAIRFVISSGDPKAITSAQNTMTYAIIGAVVVLGSFILVNIVTTTLNIPNPAVNFSIFNP